MTPSRGKRSPHFGSSGLRLAIAFLITVLFGSSATILGGQLVSPSCGVAMQILLVSGDGAEAGLPAIRQTLEYLGTPYKLHVAKDTPGALTADYLATGCRGHFQGVILATGEVGYFAGGNWISGLTAAEFEALAVYETQFGVRQVTWYTFPTPDYGFQWGALVSPASHALPATLTAAGKSVFTYLAGGNAANPITVEQAHAYLAQPLDAATTPLLVDAAGHALAAVKRYPGGRENLALTFDGAEYLRHSVVLGYGIVNWVTRGLFLGERRVYMSPQVDDIFIDTEEWVPGTPCGTPPSAGLEQLRMSGADLQAVVAWQAARRGQATTAGLRLSMAFNGWGTTGVFEDDTLTPAAQALQREFHWINHTWDHEVLDAVDYASAWNEITLNNAVGRSMAFTSFSPTNLVTPEISGLMNPAFLQAAVDAGVRYLVSDSSRTGYDNPFPNSGIVHPQQAALLMIPRRPNNLFYNVATPAAWLAEYNCVYRGFWGRDLTWAEIVDLESDQLVMHMVRGENNPWMFHQANLVRYDGTRFLLADVLDRTLDKYNRLFNLPVVSPSMDALGATIEKRMRYLDARVTATLQPGVSITLESDRPVTVPITGLDIAGADWYGGQPRAWVSLAAGQPVSISLSPATPPPAGGLPSPWTSTDIGAVGAAGAAAYDATTSRFTVSGAGSDIWGTADAFQFTYQALPGDGTVTARVVSVENTDPWTKAGVMIRQSLDPGSAHAMMVVSAGRGLAFQRRRGQGGTSVHTAGPAATAPYWVRLERAGTRVRAFRSEDGAAWTLVGSDAIAWTGAVHVGLAITSHVAARLSTAVFDNVTVTMAAPPPPPPPPALPAAWSSSDIGAVGKSGSATFDAATGVFTVAGAGADVWGTVDAFRYVYRRLTGDGVIVARVTTLQRSDAWTKAGVMIRASLQPSAAHAFVLVSAEKGVAFQRRPLDAGATVHTGGPLAAAPYWLKLQRNGNTITASASADGNTWTALGSDTISMNGDVYVGLAVTSHTTAATAKATFSDVATP